MNDVTGYAENAAIRAGFLGTNMSMITKPFALDALTAKIDEMVTTAAGRRMPATAAAAPGRPHNRQPIQIAMFLALTPGSACGIASPSRKSSSLGHARSVTSSRSSQPLSQPPKLVSEMRANTRKSRYVVGAGLGSSGVTRTAGPSAPASRAYHRYRDPVRRPPGGPASTPRSLRAPSLSPARLRPWPAERRKRRRRPR